MSTERTPWPRFCAEPEDALNWLNKQRPADKVGQKAVFTLRWMLHQELEERKPGPMPTGISHFIPDEPQKL